MSENESERRDLLDQIRKDEDEAARLERTIAAAKAPDAFSEPNQTRAAAGARDVLSLVQTIESEDARARARLEEIRQRRARISARIDVRRRG